MFGVRPKMSKVPITNKVSTFLANQRLFPSKITSTNLIMKSQQNSKRPTCQTCSKPLGLCLCTRFKTPNFNNNVHVTILQHSLEIKHPLNSARIAKLGLRNLQVFNVTDVMIEAQFQIQPLKLGKCHKSMDLFEEECTLSVCRNAPVSLDSDKIILGKRSPKQSFEFDDGSDLDSGAGSIDVSEPDWISSRLSENFDDIVEVDSSVVALPKNDDHLIKQCDADVTANCKSLLSVTVGKYGKISSISRRGELQNEGKVPEFEHFFAKPEVLESLTGGFMVQKLQKKNCGSLELEQFKEYQIAVPPGSVLLFPAQKAEPAEAIDFEVKNLIVLDGTWAKANRMYNENPWLKLLPAVRLDIEKMSMFSEVRRQPKPGYLSTVESIVYALKALGRSEKLEGLDNLLDVFESMVEDQRRCKDERIKRLSQ